MLRPRLIALACLVLVVLPLRAAPLFQQFTNILVMSNANVRLEYNLNSGRTDFFWQHARKITGFYAGVNLTSYVTGTSFSNRTWSILSPTQVVVTALAAGLPTMKQYFVLDQDNSFLTRVEMAGSRLSSRWMGPVVMDTAGGVDLGVATDNRALYVPFDNDHFVRYNAMPMNSTSNSYEVCAFYDNTSRNGLVVGSVTHDAWKTGIYFVGSNNKLNTLNVYGGANSTSATWDVLPHGPVIGNTISSPTVFVGFGADWRSTMESYADENASMVPKVPWTNGVPFGWNSWYAFTTSVSHDKAVAVSDFIKNNLQNSNFNNNGVVYVNLDSYWDNLTDSQLQDFVNHCHANGQKAGIYWSPWVWWGAAANVSNSWVEGTSYAYHYSDVALWTPSGVLQTNDGGIAMDPCHPGIRQRVDYYLNNFTSKGFDYIKLDFLSHGAMEGVHYDPTVTTGIQAYNQGMNYLFGQINGRMFISESIAPLFPYNYAHSRRIACDTAHSISDTAYEMQSVTYGWWLSGRVYQFNDPDLMQFAGATAYENQSRLISGAVSGTLFLNSDDLTSTTGQNLALNCLTNAAINAVARVGRTFRPVEGNTGTSAADTFVRQDRTNWYVAVFNYSSSAVDKPTDLARAGVPAGTLGAVDLWSGVLLPVSANSFTGHYEAKQSKLYRLVTNAVFVLSGTPASQVVNSGGSTNFTINVTTTPGFANNIALTVSGLPTGAAASFNPASLSGAGSSVLTITTSNNTPAASYSLVVTGTSAVFTNNATVLLVVGRGVRANLKWNSTLSSAWDVGASFNWLNLGTSAADQYYPGDGVLFDDTPGVQTSVSIASGVAVLPATMTNNSSANNFSITGGGTISGSLTLVKQGASTLTLGTANDFSGRVLIQGGTLVLGNASALGAASATVSITNGSTLDLHGCTLDPKPIVVSGVGANGNGAIVNSVGSYPYISSLTLAGDTTFGGSQRWDLHGTLTSGGHNVVVANTYGGYAMEWRDLACDTSLANVTVNSGSGLGWVGTTTAGSSGTLTVNGNLTFYNDGTNNANVTKPIVLNNGSILANNGGASVISAPVTLNGNDTFKVNGASLLLNNVVSGPGTLIKTGNSPLKVAAALSFTGNLIISNGTVGLLGAGSMSSCAAIVVNAGTTLDVSGRTDKTLTLASGQTLRGNGTINGSVTVTPGATLASGDAANIGALTITNAVTLSGITVMKLNQLAATNDLVLGASSITYGGILCVTNLAGSLAPSDSFQIFSAAVYVPSTFSALTPPTPGPGLAWDTSTLAIDGTLRIAFAPPVLGTVQFQWTNIVLTGTGAPSGTFHLFSCTNLAPANWLPAGTGAFDNAGTFSFSLSNNPATPRTFYRLQVP